MRLLITLALLFWLPLAAACGGGGDETAGASNSEVSGGDGGVAGTDTTSQGPAGPGPTTPTNPMDPNATADASGCEPACEDKNCGDDGCGGVCGTCSGTFVCDAGVCASCVPTCQENGCGPDGCGGICGTCGDGEFCIMGQCEPPPPAICLDLVPCLLAACDGEADDIATCIDAELAGCGPTDSTEDEVAATALVTCLADNGCPFVEGSARAECQRGSCLPETVTCTAKVEGDQECHTLIQCVESDDCEKNILTGEVTTACIADCMVTGTTDAVTKYWDLMLCVDAQCLDSPVYDDMQLCFLEETDTGGACGWPLRDCLVSAL